MRTRLTRLAPELLPTFLGRSESRNESKDYRMTHKQGRWLAIALGTMSMWAGGESLIAAGPSENPVSERARLRMEPVSDDPEQLTCGFTQSQISLLEKLNRSDRDHLVELNEIVVPERWDLDELAYSPLAVHHAALEGFAKALVVHKPGQVFCAYEKGRLVRWGAVNSGAESTPTPSGLFYLNWKSPGHRSTVNRNWFLPWYFNFHNRRGHSFHHYELPGKPASHGCLRLLERDAMWLYEWGDEWTLGPRGWTIENPGTAVLIVGEYDHSRQAPWRTARYLMAGGRLPFGEDMILVTLLGSQLSLHIDVVGIDAAGDD